MKKTFLFIIVSFFLCCAADAQVRVKDENKLNQLKSMDFIQWKFTPDWYYYSWHRKKIGFISMKVPGLGIHDKGPGGIGGGDNYVRKYDRNFVQIIPLISATYYDKRKNIIEGNMYDTICRQETAKFLDRSIDRHYFRFKKKFKKLRNYIIDECRENLLNNGKLENNVRIIKNLERVEKNVKIMYKSHISSSEKLKAYMSYELQLQETLNVAKALNKIERVAFKTYKN